jgi:adenylate cyclase
MPGRDYIQLLNVYFDTTAGLIIKAGGEVLDFIGDGVLAIFPFQDAIQQQVAIRAATGALRDVIGARDALNEQRAEQGLIALRFGIGLNTGKVMFGNIGVPERLTFSVIGPTVNEVSRIESLTKATGMDALVTHEIAAFDPQSWISIGVQRLAGVSEGMELFTLARERLQMAPGTDKTRQAAAPN